MDKGRRQQHFKKRHTLVFFPFESLCCANLFACGYLFRGPSPLNGRQGGVGEKTGDSECAIRGGGGGKSLLSFAVWIRVFC